MSNKKSAYVIVDERLGNWFLFKKKSFSLSLEQLAELRNGLQAPARLGWKTTKRAQFDTLMEHLNQINKGKKC